MNLLTLLQDRFRVALAGLVDDPTPYAAMVKPAQDAALRGLPDQLRHRAWPNPSVKSRATSPRKSFGGFPWMTCSNRRRLPGRASSISGSRVNGWRGSCKSWPETIGSASSRRPNRKRLSSNSARQTWPNRCTSATCAAPSSATAWPGCCASWANGSLPTITSAIGACNSACCCTVTSNSAMRRP